MAKFKVGDKVRHLTERYTGTVTKLFRNDGNGMYVRQDDRSGLRVVFPPEVELIRQFKPGDVAYYAAGPYRTGITALDGGEYAYKGTVPQPDVSTYGLFYADELRPMRAYLAGPMTGYDRFNFDAFEEAAAALRQRAIVVISPAEMDLEEGLDPNDPISPDDYAAFLARDIEKIAAENIDAIIVLPGWEKSGGAKAEVAFCRALGKEVLQYPLLDPAIDYSLDFVPLTGTTGAEERPHQQHHVTVSGFKDVAAKLADGGTVASFDDGWYFGIDNGPVSAVQNPKDAGATDKTRLDLLEPAADTAIAGALADGERKYGTRNYIDTPIRARVYIAAMRRHLAAYLSGQDFAADSGLHHLAHVGANIHILFAAMDAGTLNDDRPTKEAT